MADSSFDIVSKVEYQEVNNAINQALKEILMRFDLKDAKCEIILQEKDNKITLKAIDEFKLKAVFEILKTKFIKREISPKALKEGKIESALGQTAKQELTLQQGISKENAKMITKDIKEKQLKVQTSIQEDQIRVVGKKKDDLQEVIKFLREKNYDFPLQFTNYR
jgi:uncharacterized protein YajQ (UPF0234 family)